jgi:Matrixin/Fibronectin type III domain/Bacterial Ig domain
MSTRTLRSRRLLPVFALAGMLSGALLQGYNDSGHRWASNSVPYYVNPQSIYVSPNAAISAVQQAAAGWSQQTNANVALVYAGTTNGSSLTLNYKNEVFFRNSSNGGNVAETYYWWDGTGRLIDADIVFWEGAYQFFAGSGCVSGIYIENVGIHEFGHALGLGHSDVPGATMAPAMSSYCDTTQLTLEPDDIAGVQAMYPPSSGTPAPTAPASLSAVQNSSSPSTSLVLTWADTSSVESGFRIERSSGGGGFSQVGQVGANVTTFTNSSLTSSTSYTFRVVAYNATGNSPYSNQATGTTAASTTNTAPNVTMNNPANNASYPEGATISFSGSATDSQDGNLSANLRWTSSLMGAIGNGASFSRTLTAGTHTITASVTDSGGMSGSRQVSMTVTVAVTAPSITGTLTARTSQVRNKTKVELNWSGLTGSRVDIYRNGSRQTTQNNTGSYTDSPNGRNSSLTYKVCVAGTQTCTNDVSVSY